MNNATTPRSADPITLDGLQTIVDRWITTIGGGYFSTLTNTAILAEEVGEVARVIARTRGDQRTKPGEHLDLADELADVIWVLAAIANQEGIDLTAAIKANIDKKTRRDSERFTN